MDPYNRREFVRAGRRRRRRKKRLKLVLIVLAILLVIAGIVFSIVMVKKSGSKSKKATEQAQKKVEQQQEAKKREEERSRILEEAQLLADMYDYDAAIERLKEFPDVSSDAVFVEAAQTYEASKASCTAYDITKIPHIFFHSLIADNAKVFDGDYEEKGYNQYMTTIDEFNRIMTEMYQNGYVLVSMHDMAYLDETGTMQKGQIMLPPGKKAFVLSVDDVNYYNYMLDDGFPSRLVVGEDGKPTTERVRDDGTTEVGDFDVVPLLDQFVEEHPDFSYRGAKGLLGITGYEGALGYRTCPTDDKNGYDESQIETAKEVAQCLKDNGWEFASHTWGHIHMGTVSLEKIKTDSEKWETQVESILGDVDIIIYPYGEDINSFRPYKTDNEKFTFLKEKGFHYFCNVDGNATWVQMGSNYLRQGRRNLDGYRLYNDYINPANSKVADLFDVTKVYDSEVRPPVPALTGPGM